MASSRKLKVFQAQFGFYDTVVAAPSQAAALRAWDVRQNLFHSGDAKITTDAAAVAAATAQPGVLLRRAVGSGDPFALEPTRLPSAPDAPRKPLRKAPPKARPAPPASPPADRSRLVAAEKGLTDLDEARKQEEANFRREADDLEARRMAAQSAYLRARKAATSKVADARTAYRKAGGAA